MTWSFQFHFARVANLWVYRVALLVLHDFLFYFLHRAITGAGLFGDAAEGERRDLPAACRSGSSTGRAGTEPAPTSARPDNMRSQFTNV